MPAFVAGADVSNLDFRAMPLRRTMSELMPCGMCEWAQDVRQSLWLDLVNCETDGYDKSLFANHDETGPVEDNMPTTLWGFAVMSHKKRVSNLLFDGS
jgi:hypothetical protein